MKAMRKKGREHAEFTGELNVRNVELVKIVQKERMELDI